MSRVHVLGVVAAIVLAAQGPARAGSVTLVGLAPSTDARKAVAIGPAGQVYEPDGKGAWVRDQLGGTAVELVGATAASGTVIAAAKAAPPFKLKRGAWTALFLVPKARAIVGTGSRVLASVGTSVFDIDGAQPVKLADAPGRVQALGASTKAAVIVTDKGLFELQGGKTWKPLKKAPRTVRSLVGPRWAIVDKGALDLSTMKTIPWPAGVRVDEATVQGDTLFVTATSGAGKARKLELLTLSGGKLAREPIPLDDDQPIVGVVVDPDHRVVVAARDGQLAVRTGGAKPAWTVVQVREELPTPKPGPAPALSAGPR